MALAIAIFVAALAAIATERADRTKVALVGAALVLITQTVDQEHAIESIDFNTIGLLAGMMLMVRLTETTGVYTWLAIRAGQLSRGHPLAVVASLALTTAVLSAFLDNLTTVLLMVPITFLLADAANVAAAGMAARAGRPIGFVAFLKIGLPATAVSMLLATAYICLRYL